MQHEKATWWDCVLWRKKEQSTNIAKYLKKGTRVYIVGNPYAETYVTANNETRVSFKCNIYQMELLSAPKETVGTAEEKNNPVADPIKDDLPW